MCTEIEAKLKVDSLEKVAEKLAQLGAEFLEEQLQKDCYFDYADAALAKSDRGLRLRRTLVGKDERFFLTYKGARKKSKFKKRQEIEFEVRDGDSAEKMLRALGYEKILTFEKKRRIWRFGHCVVALDQLPLLGNFVEIEGADDKIIADMQRSLGLADLPHVGKTYSTLMKEKLSQPGM